MIILLSSSDTFCIIINKVILFFWWLRERSVGVNVGKARRSARHYRPIQATRLAHPGHTSRKHELHLEAMTYVDANK